MPRPTKPLERNTPLSRSPMRRTPPKSGIPQSVREIVRLRSGGICEINAVCVASPAVHQHHRKLRSQGGRHVPGNLLDCCALCHAYAHAHPALSYERGWLIRGNQE